MRDEAIEAVCEWVECRDGDVFSVTDAWAGSGPPVTYNDALAVLADLARHGALELVGTGDAVRYRRTDVA